MEPLAAHMRPQKLEEVFGQEHLTSPGKPFYEAISKKHLFSFVLWGPPGTGKTTLARIYAATLNASLFELSAVSAGKDDIRAIVGEKTEKPKVLFLDEIHRFTKSQQDYLLPYVESGELTLIGATTENPSFEVISALLSRLQVFVLEQLSVPALEKILLRADTSLSKEACTWLGEYANGDARQALTLLALTKELYGSVTTESLREAAQSKHVRYDRAGEEHYNTVSAFIKSMRAGDQNAALYYLARMVEAGEDPLFIARRMVIFASEDIGLAQPTALVVANAVFRAVETVGYPECAINLAHGASYLASAQKDRSAYDALRAAQADVRKFGNLSIPLSLRNAPTKLMKELEYGKGYEMYGGSRMPEKLKEKTYFPQSKKKGGVTQKKSLRNPSS